MYIQTAIVQNSVQNVTNYSFKMPFYVETVTTTPEFLTFSTHF